MLPKWLVFCTIALLSSVPSLKAQTFDVKRFYGFLNCKFSQGLIKAGPQEIPSEVTQLLYDLDLKADVDVPDLSLSTQCVTNMAEYLAMWALPFDDVLTNSSRHWSRKSKF